MSASHSGFILPMSGEWVGPPVLKLRLRLGAKEEILDGRKRLREHQTRGLRTTVPELIVRSHYEAIRYLILHGHQDRAAEYTLKQAPMVAHQTTESLRFFLNLDSHHRLIPFLRALRSPAERHKLPRRAMSVVKRVRTLHAQALEGEEVSVQDLADALGEFIKD